MRFRVVSGKNFKNYVLIDDLTTEVDFELHKLIIDTLSRTEYNPFIAKRGGNGRISASYIFRETLFPAQFWQDVEKQLFAITGKHYLLEGEEYLYNNELEFEDFKDFVSKLKVPDDIKTDDKKYIYQQESAYLAIKNKIGRIEVGTSGGKTFITYLYCRYIFDNLILKDSFSNALDGQKILIIVPNKLLVTQLVKDFAHYQENESRKLVIQSIYSGAKKILDADVVCGTFQSLGNYEQEYFNDFKFIVCDEVHRSKAYTIRQEIYSKILNAEYFFGMSGTYPKYSSVDYLHIVSMFGPLLYEKPIKSLIDNGISVPVKIHVIKINYSKEKKEEYHNMNIEAHENHLNRYYCEKNFFQKYQERTYILYKLLNAYNKNALILVDTVEYCDIIKIFLSSHFGDQKHIEIIHGNVNNREEIIYDFKHTENNFILIGTYGTMSTGISIKNIEQIYFIDGGKSEIRIRQSIGRGIRLYPNKEYCDVFDFYDYIPGELCAFTKQARERMKIYNSQKLEFKISEVTI